jgi:hypothetical protein
MAMVIRLVFDNMLVPYLIAFSSVNISLTSRMQLTGYVPRKDVIIEPKE